MRSEPDAGRSLVRWGRGRSGAGIEVERDLVVEAVHQMPVAVHGHRDRTVPETSLDGFRMQTVGDEPRGCVPAGKFRGELA